MPVWVRRTVSGIVAAMAATIVMLAAAAPAAAHEQLASSSPSEGERLDVAPTQVELVFTDEVLTMDSGDGPLGAVVMVVDEAGRDWAVGDLSVDGARVVTAVETGMPVAGYQVRWQIVSGDGHPISGAIPFTIGDGAPFTTADASEPEPSADADGSDTGAGASQDEPYPLWRVLLIAAVGAGVALAVFLIISFFRRRGQGRPGDTGGSPT